VAERRAPRIWVVAGPNGAGKSSIAAATIRAEGGDTFDPDAVARRLRARDRHLTVQAANAAAWQAGKLLLERAIAHRLDFAFETTLGGRTIPALLARAADAAFEVRLWYAALDTPERHLARIRRRVALGGHDIAEADVRRRYDTSRENLVRLLPKLTALRVYDNSAEADPATGATPTPRLVRYLERGTPRGPRDLAATPAWARGIVAAALKTQRR
jgi:predicted ABC-type ATPase